MYKANVLLLLLSSLVTRKVFAIYIGIATEQSFRYIELTDAKIWISKNVSLCQVLANCDTNYVLLMKKWVYCYMYQGNSYGSDKLNYYSTNNL